MMQGRNHPASVMLGRVESVEDPDGLARVEVRFPMHVSDDDNASLVWAPVATAFAGSDYGAFLLPGVGDVVVPCLVGVFLFCVVVGGGGGGGGWVGGGGGGGVFV